MAPPPPIPLPPSRPPLLQPQPASPPGPATSPRRCRLLAGQTAASLPRLLRRPWWPSTTKSVGLLLHGPAAISCAAVLRRRPQRCPPPTRPTRLRSAVAVPAAPQRRLFPRSGLLPCATTRSGCLLPPPSSTRLRAGSITHRAGLRLPGPAMAPPPPDLRGRPLVPTRPGSSIRLSAGPPPPLGAPPPPTTVRRSRRRPGSVFVASRLQVPLAGRFTPRPSHHTRAPPTPSLHRADRASSATAPGPCVTTSAAPLLSGRCSPWPCRLSVDRAARRHQHARVSSPPSAAPFAAFGFPLVLYVCVYV